MKSVFSKGSCIVALALAIPALGMCDAVAVNGVCVSGNCVTPDSIASPGSSSGSTSNTITVNGDLFGVNTNFLASFTSGTSFTADPAVTYLGSAPSTHSDSVIVDMYQSFFSPGTGVNWDGTYNEHFPGTVPDNAMASAETFVNGQGIALLGPYGPGSYFTSASADLTNVDGNTVTYDVRLTLDFSPGLTPGSTFTSSVTPEPVETIPVAIGFAGFGLMAYRRRKANNLR
jgi:hypothetical protein